MSSPAPNASAASSPSSIPPAPSTLSIRLDDLRGHEIAALLHEHYTSMFAHLAALRAPEISFWSAWFGDALAGCVALKDLGGGHAELKSMRTAAAFMRRGVAAALMEHVLTQARLRRITRISLETGSMAFFEPARKMYERFGFKECGPFGDYELDPYSVFMTTEIAAEEEEKSLSPLSQPLSLPSVTRSDSVNISRPTSGFNFLRSLQMCFPFLSRFLFEVELYPLLAVSRGVRDAVTKEIEHLLAQDQKRLVARRSEIIAKLAHLKQIRSAHSPDDQAALDRACADRFFGNENDHVGSRLPPQPAEIHAKRLQALEAAVDAGGKLPIGMSVKSLMTFIDDLLLDRLTVQQNHGPNSVPRPEPMRADLAVLLPMIQAVMLSNTDLWNVRCDYEWHDAQVKPMDKLMRAAIYGQRHSPFDASSAKQLHMPTVRALGELVVWAVTVRRVLGEHNAMLDTLRLYIGDKYCKSAFSMLQPFGQQHHIAELRQIRFNIVRACAQTWSGAGESDPSATAVASEEPPFDWAQEMYWIRMLSYAPADMLCLLLSLSPRFVCRLRTMLSPRAPSAQHPVPLITFLEPCLRGDDGRAFLRRLMHHRTFREGLLHIPLASEFKQTDIAPVDPAALLLSFSSSSAAAPTAHALTIGLLFALVSRKERSLLADLLSISPAYFRSVWSSLRDDQGNSLLHLAAEVRGRRNKIFSLLWRIAIAAAEESSSIASSSPSSPSSSPTSLSPAAVRVLSDCNASGVSLASMLDEPRNDELREIAHGKVDGGDEAREAAP